MSNLKNESINDFNNKIIPYYAIEVFNFISRELFILYYPVYFPLSFKHYLIHCLNKTKPSELNV